MAQKIKFGTDGWRGVIAEALLMMDTLVAKRRDARRRLLAESLAVAGVGWLSGW